MFNFWNYLKCQSDIDEKLIDIAYIAEKQARSEFEQLSHVVKANQLKVLEAFRQAHISEYYLRDGTGYGYGDLSREGLERVYEYIFGAEAALVRAQIISGTHAISLALTALLDRGDELISATGRPYDTLAKVIGGDKRSNCSLVGQGIIYKEVPLKDESEPDYEKINAMISEKTRVLFIQRSRGYSWRKPLSIEKIRELIMYVKKINTQILCFVDNCYGEFVEDSEPTHVGADLIAGSLIKNPGGGLAPAGGYLAGKKDLIINVADRLIAPGLGLQIGTNLGLGRFFYQGIFMAPHIVGEALKGAIFAAHFFSNLGFETSPQPGSARSDLVQAIKINTADGVKAFCKGIQAASPIDSFVIPEPYNLPGYEDKIIMAAGTFVQGSSIELSADAPIRPPYIVYLQGGLSYEHTLLGVLQAAQELLKIGVIK